MEASEERIDTYNLENLAHEAVDGSTIPKNADPLHKKDSVEKASKDTNSETYLGEMTGTTGGIGSVKISSANSTSCSHDAMDGETSAGGKNAKEHDSEASCN